MQWSNLYSAESKYKIIFTDSYLQRVMLIVENLFLFVIFGSYCLIYPSDNVSDYLFFLIAITSIVLGRFYYQYTKLSIINNIEVLLSGICQFDQYNQWKIAGNSRINWLGCYLVLVSNNSEKKLKQTLFIYRDSVSKKDYSRLCRIILKVKTLPAANSAY